MFVLELELELEIADWEGSVTSEEESEFNSVFELDVDAAAVVDDIFFSGAGLAGEWDKGARLVRKTIVGGGGATLFAIVFILLDDDSEENNAMRICGFENGIIILPDLTVAMIAEERFELRTAIIGLSIARLLRYMKAA